jgi:hypothetical protein
MACGWLTDRFGLCWQTVPRNIGQLISRPKAREAMMGMIKIEVVALEAAPRKSSEPSPSQNVCGACSDRILSLPAAAFCGYPCYASLQSPISLPFAAERSRSL